MGYIRSDESSQYRLEDSMLRFAALLPSGGSEL